MRYNDVAIPAGAAWSSPFLKWQGALAEVSSIDLAADVTTRASKLAHWTRRKWLASCSAGRSRSPTYFNDTDEGVRPALLEEISALRPAGKDGLHTFSSQTQPSDGTAGAVVGSSQRHANSAAAKASSVSSKAVCREYRPGWPPSSVREVAPRQSRQPARLRSGARGLRLTTTIFVADKRAGLTRERAPSELLTCSRSTGLASSMRPSSPGICASSMTASCDPASMATR